jgi:hypothetical protein
MELHLAKMEMDEQWLFFRRNSRPRGIPPDASFSEERPSVFGLLSASVTILNSCHPDAFLFSFGSNSATT